MRLALLALLHPLEDDAAQLKDDLDGDEQDDDPLEAGAVLLARQLAQHLRDLGGVVHLLVERADAHVDVERAADLVVVALEAELGPAVPEDVGQGVGELRVVVQPGAQAEQLARLLEDEFAAEGHARAFGEEGGDVARALEVACQRALQDGEFGAAREAGGEGHLGEGGVEGVAVSVLLSGSEDDDVALERAGFAVDVGGEFEIFNFLEVVGMGIFCGPEDLSGYDVRREGPCDDCAGGEDKYVAPIDSSRMNDFVSVETRSIWVNCEPMGRQNLQNHGHIERFGNTRCTNNGRRIIPNSIDMRPPIRTPFGLLRNNGHPSQGVLGRGRSGRFALGRRGRGRGGTGAVIWGAGGGVAGEERVGGEEAAFSGEARGTGYVE